MPRLRRSYGGIMKKKAVGILAALAIFCGMLAAIPGVAYADQTAAQSAKELYETYTAGKELGWRDEFLLGSWVTYYDYDITPHEEQMQLMHESGLNFAFAPFDWYDRSVYDSLEDWQAIDALCEQYEMYYLLSGGENGQGANQDSLDNGTAWAKEMGDRMLGYHLKDEPPRATFESLSSWYKKYREADPEHYPYVNLYPSYVGSQGLGGTYREYLQAWIDAVGAENMMALSHDFYPFGTSSTNVGIFSDLEDMRSVAYENGKLATHGFIQSTGWAGMRMPNLEEIRWHVYAYLAYGFKALSYFNYCNPGTSIEGFEVSLMMPDGTIPDQELFDGVAELNWNVRLLGTELVKLDTVHAYHTTGKYSGTEVLPTNFFLRPIGDCDFVVSLMESKDNSGYSVMLFNNSWTQGCEQTFFLDSFSGAEGLEYFNIHTGQWEEVNTSSGSFTMSFAAGEGKLLRVKGDLQVDENVDSPVFSLDPGVYDGPQTIEIVAEEGDEIYYTLDGSYPVPETAVRYEGPVRIGKEKGSEGVVLRAVAVRQGISSKVTTAEYAVLDESRNVALGASVTLSREGVPYSSGRSYGAEVITDGIADPDYSYGTRAGKLAWATVDLGMSYPIDKVCLRLYDNASAEAVIVQISNDKTFRKGVKTLLNTDVENISGYGGAAAAQGEFPEDGVVLSDGTSARYVRVYCKVNNRSLFTEIEVFQTPVGGQSPPNGGAGMPNTGKWAFGDRAEHQANGSQSDALLVADTDMQNPVVEGDFSFGEHVHGFIGFEFFKRNLAAQGFRIGVTPAGQVRWQIGNRFGYGAKAQEFNSGKFHLKVACIGSYAVVKVDGVLVDTISAAEIEVRKGQVAVYAGNNDMSVSGVVYSETENVCSEIEHTLQSIEALYPLTVELNTVYEDVVAQLPDLAQATDEEGRKYTVALRWSCENYCYSEPGVYYFYGEPENAINLLNVRVQVVVTVRSKINYANIDAYLRAADMLDPNDYTEDSWNNVAVYYDNAVSVRADMTLPQNAINVAAMQLEGAINSLVYRDAENYKATLRVLYASANVIPQGNYTQASYNILQEILQRAEEVLADGLSSREEVSQCESILSLAIGGLQLKGDVSVLAGLVEKAKGLNSSQYTETSVRRLQQVVDIAEVYISMQEIDEEIVTCLVNELNAKINALVLV